MNCGLLYLGQGVSSVFQAEPVGWNVPKHLGLRAPVTRIVLVDSNIFWELHRQKPVQKTE